MQIDYACASIPILADTGVECLSQLFSLIFIVGFLLIVVMSEKYRYMAEWLLKKLDGWF